MAGAAGARIRLNSPRVVCGSASRSAAFCPARDSDQPFGPNLVWARYPAREPLVWTPRVSQPKSVSNQSGPKLKEGALKCSSSQVEVIETILRCAGYLRRAGFPAG